MKDVSSRFLSTISLPHRVETLITCTPPGGVTTRLRFDSCSVSAYSGTGRRKSAECVFAPIPNFDLYEVCSAPGAVFHISHGFRYSPTSVELVSLLDGEASSEASPLNDGSVSLSLTDFWARIDRTRFIDPHTPVAGMRAQTIADTIQAGLAAPVPQSVTTDGGSQTGVSTWDRDRTQAVTDLATDGGLEAYVDSDGAAGTIVVRPVPTLDPEAFVWTVRSGEGGTLIDGSRTRPLDRLYNTVVVLPANDTQSWTRQISQVTNPDHPRYPGKIGVVPFFWSSPTATTAARAKAAGDAILSRVLGTTETITLTSVTNAALEPGDVVQVLKSGPVGQRVGTVDIIDSWVLDCVAGSMTIDSRSSTAGDLEEAA